MNDALLRQTAIKGLKKVLNHLVKAENHLTSDFTWSTVNYELFGYLDDNLDCMKSRVDHIIQQLEESE